MTMRQLISAVSTSVALIAVTLFAGTASAITVTGTVEPNIPSGQHMALTMTIDDTTTTFELTGPDFSWFAFGFNTMTMQGYSLIVEGINDQRMVVEQNLVGRGNPGSPQATQNLVVVDSSHDQANDLSTLVIQRPNNTGDPNDPVFTTSMTSLPIIWGYDSFASPAIPNPDLTYHGFSGRGFATITLAVVPEPAGLLLAAMAAVVLAAPRRRK
jgi:hypothetical protein